MAPWVKHKKCRKGVTRMFHKKGDPMMLDCCCCGPQFRRFMTSEEKQKMLEEYKEQLEKELAGVKERIDELTKG